MFKKKALEIKAPSSGKVVDIESVNDEVFSTKLAGDGVAIIPTDGAFCSPIDGVIVKIFDTNHAYIIKASSGLEVLVHIGIDTVMLNGEGFSRILEPHSDVKAGDLVIKVDLDYLKDNGKDIISPIVISDEESYKDMQKYLGDKQLNETIMEVK